MAGDSPAAAPRTPRTKDAKAERALGDAGAVRRRRAGGGARARARTTRIAGWSRSIRRPARSASSTRCTTTRGCARSAAASAGRSVVRPAAGSEARVVPVRARRLDAPLHASTSPTPQPPARQLTQGKWEIDDVALSRRPEDVLHHQHRGASGRAAHLRDADRRRRAHEADVDDRRRRPARSRPTTARFGLIYSYSTKPPEVYVMPNRAGAAATQVDDHDRARSGASFKWIEPQLITYKTRDGVDVYARLFTPEMIGAQARSGRAGGGLRARRRLPAERAQVLVELLPRVHVPQPAGVARLRRARRRLPRQRRLRPRLAHRDLPPHGRQGSRGHRRRREVSGRRRRRSTRSGSASTAAATAASSR